MPLDADIARNLADVRRRLEAAAHRSRRSPSAISLVAVSKTFGSDRIRAAAAAGQRIFGENRVQEGLGKIDALADLDLTWHLIGHLQSNKARKAAAAFHWVESVDSLPLLQKLDRAAVEAGGRRSILLQVDLAREATKHGAPGDDIFTLAAAAIAAEAIDLRGLMIVPPAPTRPDDSRIWFRRLVALRDSLVARGIPAGRLSELSMGMSQDFEVAIEEGATIIRLGGAIFGPRPPAGESGA